MDVRTKLVKLVGGLAVCALALAACGSSGGSSSSSPTSAPAATSTTAASATTAPAASDAEDGVRVIAGSATGTSPCEKAAPTPASPGEVGTGSGGSNQNATPAEVAASEHGVRGAVEPVPLSKGEQAILDMQLGQAAQVARQFPTVRDAEHAGYAMSTPYVPCIGAHYTNVGLAASFDPAKPSELLYAGTTPDARIVGLSYLVWHHGGPPPGFAGPNDRWHQHNANGGLCLKGGLVVGGEETTRADCAARGGRKTLLTDVWMVHAWVVPGLACTWGVFSGECPALGGKLGGTAFDPPYATTMSASGASASSASSG
jgi:hypothetical protein